MNIPFRTALSVALFFGLSAMAAPGPIALAQQTAGPTGGGPFSMSLVNALSFDTDEVSTPQWSVDSSRFLLPTTGLSRRSALELWQARDNIFSGRQVLADVQSDEPVIVAWRPDGQAVAVLDRKSRVYGGPDLQLRIFSVPDLRVIAQAVVGHNGRIDDLRPVFAEHAMAFSGDGASLWLATATDSNADRVPAAAQMTVALRIDPSDLTVSGVQQIDNPTPGGFAMYGFSRVEPVGTGVRITAVVHTATRGRTESCEVLSDIWRPVVYVVDVDGAAARVDRFDVPIDNAADTDRGAQDAQLSADGRTLLVHYGDVRRLSIACQRGAPGRPSAAGIDLSADRSFDVFDMTTHRRVAKFGGLESPEFDDIARSVGGGLTPDGRYYVFATYRPGGPAATASVAGAVVAVEAATGSVVQKVSAPGVASPAGWSMSPDGRTLLLPARAGQGQSLIPLMPLNDFTLLLLGPRAAGLSVDTLLAYSLSY